MTLGMLALLTQNSINIISKYFNFDVVVKTTMERNGRLPFPAVTICNANGYKKSKINDLLQEIDLKEFGKFKFLFLIFYSHFLYSCITFNAKLWYPGNSLCQSFCPIQF